MHTGGVNVLDTPINYRKMISERVVCAALRYLLEWQDLERNQVFISTKLGYVPDDFANKVDGK